MGRSGGGGGRSSGGNRGRSSGGRSSGGGRSRSSCSSSSRSSSGFGGFGGHRHTPHHHHHYTRPRYSGRSGCSVVGAVVIIIFLVILFQIVSMVGGFSSGSDVTKSTIAREPLPKGSVVETDYYTDDIGDWISNATKLTAGMKNFYKATGVQPYLYIADNLGGNIRPTDADADIWMNKQYDELFQDEAHTLLVFFERNGQYSMWYLNGKQAKTVMDTEAMDILMDYVELYYYSDLTEDEMFSKAYDMAAVRIMEVTKDPIPWYAYFFILIAVIVIIIILFKFWKAKKTQKNIEDENTRAILETPLEDLGNLPKE